MFLHVDDNAGQPEDEHPRQGALPVLKLVWQPSTQLPEIPSRLASFAMTDVGAANVVVSEGSLVGDVRCGAVTRTVARCVGCLCLGVWLGASTVMLGSTPASPEDGAVAENAVPLRPHVNSAMLEQARTRFDENLMAMS